MNHNRRMFLTIAGLAPIAFLEARRVQAAEVACYDPATLSFSENNRRRTVGFVEKSDDPNKRCGLCAFFAAQQGNCGTCQLMSGGRVTSAGVCNSFAHKPG